MRHLDNGLVFHRISTSSKPEKQTIEFFCRDCFSLLHC